MGLRRRSLILREAGGFSLRLKACRSTVAKSPNGRLSQPLTASCITPGCSGSGKMTSVGKIRMLPLTVAELFLREHKFYTEL
ncbi:MAG: hypothetical protein Ct9H300mP13_5420 [Gammaproteobacteria bacterium]|nr:MAG: hypothetical protein Ct9H300mP13_5420 [Gammaproteobacteria bacterium]